MLSLQGAASPSLLHHGGVLLDRVRDHARAPTKPHESGVYDNGGARDLPCARGSSIPYFDGGGDMSWHVQRSMSGDSVCHHTNFFALCCSSMT
jgi:hypothetical protein